MQLEPPHLHTTRQIEGVVLYWKVPLNVHSSATGHHLSCFGLCFMALLPSGGLMYGFSIQRLLTHSHLPHRPADESHLESAFRAMALIQSEWKYLVTKLTGRQTQPVTKWMLKLKTNVTTQNKLNQNWKTGSYLTMPVVSCKSKSLTKWIKMNIAWSTVPAFVTE